jgi:NTP pyrophosphatase (non-canonical NTP hydrolase)
VNTQDAIATLVRDAHYNAVAHGFWPAGAARNAGELIALIHSEASELLEAVRKPGKSDHIPGFTGEEEELADILIRVFDYAGGRNLNLAEALHAKLAFNAGREFKHGKAF